VGARQETARTVASGHGRIAQRHRTTRAALVGDSEGPGLAQVFALGRHVLTHKTGKERVAVVYGVTRLRPERAPPGRLWELVRGQWQIANPSHGVRDVTFDADRSQGRCGHLPHVMVALRHTALGLLRWAGPTNIAAACRQLAAQPAQALALIGIVLENEMTLPLAHAHGRRKLTCSLALVHLRLCSTRLVPFHMRRSVWQIFQSL
jgi:hypothetical protein